jgi:hypothetical protein
MMCSGVSEGCCGHLIILWELSSVNLRSLVLALCTDTGYLLMVRCSPSVAEDVSMQITLKNQTNTKKVMHSIQICKQTAGAVVQCRVLLKFMVPGTLNMWG